MKTNVIEKLVTHEGGPAAHQTPIQELERAVASCLLFENTYYESGSEIAKRIVDLCKQVSIGHIGDLATTARQDWNLRHVPLFLIVQMLRNREPNPLHSQVIATTIAQV